MSLQNLHDEHESLGRITIDYEVLVGTSGAFVVLLRAELPEEERTFKLAPVYAELIRAAYDRGRRHLPMYRHRMDSD